MGVAMVVGRVLLACTHYSHRTGVLQKEACSKFRASSGPFSQAKKPQPFTRPASQQASRASPVLTAAVMSGALSHRCAHSRPTYPSIFTRQPMLSYYLLLLRTVNCLTLLLVLRQLESVATPLCLESEALHCNVRPCVVLALMSRTDSFRASNDAQIARVPLVDHHRLDYHQ